MLTAKITLIKKKILTEFKALPLPCLWIEGVRRNPDVALVVTSGTPQIRSYGYLATLLKTNLDMFENLVGSFPN